MARKFITPMGKHKPVVSSWHSMDSKAYSRSYEPETRPDFRVYVTGQAEAAQQAYEARIKRDADLQKIAEGMARLRKLGLA
tara:strand:- start:1239 stop:1481 length:243 start_codon:yes stop_codon:yes gene_type:complete